jgi:leucine dehydrogenase
MTDMPASGDELRAALESWDGLAVVSRYDAPTGAWMFIALHDNTLGPMSGGTRMKLYSCPAEGLRDAMRLAEGMTRKWAAIEFGCGGGKAVLALSREFDTEERDGLLRRYGQLVDSLNGTFGTGPDLGTSMRDMLLVAEETRFIHGIDHATGEYLDSGPFTARGVLAAIHACLRHRFGEPSAAGRTVVVEGLGGVGAPLARMLAAEGATLLLVDVAAGRAEALAAELTRQHEGSASAFDGPADVAREQPCDVYAPCATGGTLNADTIQRLACAIVAGSANNQLAEPQDAERLAERGILYAPDYIANGAGAITFGLLGSGERDQGLIGQRIDGIADTLAEVFAEAEREGLSTAVAADRRVERVLSKAREARVPRGAKLTAVE